MHYSPLYKARIVQSFGEPQLEEACASYSSMGLVRIGVMKAHHRPELVACASSGSVATTVFMR